VPFGKNGSEKISPGTNEILLYFKQFNRIINIFDIKVVLVGQKGEKCPKW